MEILKKTILQAVTTGITSGGDVVITGDTGVTYYIKIGLKQCSRDIGFFDVFIEPPEPIPPEPPEPPAETFYLVDSGGNTFVDGNNNNIIYE